MEAVIDRRIFQRMASDFTGWYTIKDSKEILGEFFGCDFSAGGLRVNAGRKILEGRALEVSLVSPIATDAITETARVVWQRETSAGIWETGLRFYQPDLMRLHLFIDPKEYSAEE